MKPILEVLGNVEKLITEENPLTLKYIFFVMHDINLIHMLTVLDYYTD